MRLPPAPPEEPARLYIIRPVWSALHPSGTSLSATTYSKSRLGSAIRVAIAAAVVATATTTALATLAATARTTLTTAAEAAGLSRELERLAHHLLKLGALLRIEPVS